MNKKQNSHPQGRQPSAPTCDNCIHTFKHNGSEDMVVCVPHLKTMPASHAQVCDLYLYSAKSQRI
jgi:hypothetical protein